MPNCRHADLPKMRSANSIRADSSASSRSNSVTCSIKSLSADPSRLLGWLDNVMRFALRPSGSCCEIDTIPERDSVHLGTIVIGLAQQSNSMIFARRSARGMRLNTVPLASHRNNRRSHSNEIWVLTKCHRTQPSNVRLYGCKPSKSLVHVTKRTAVDCVRPTIGETDVVRVRTDKKLFCKCDSRNKLFSCMLLDKHSTLRKITRCRLVRLNLFF